MRRAVESPPPRSTPHSSPAFPPTALVMDDPLSAALGRVASLAAGLGAEPSAGELEATRQACAAAVAVAKGQGILGAAPQKRLWEAAGCLWNASIDLRPAGSDGGAGGGADSARWRAAATVLQAACDLCAPLSPTSLLPPEALNLVRFHHRAGQAYAALGEHEAAEAVLARGGERLAGLLPLCFERRGRGPLHQEAASVAFSFQLERLAAALALDQQVLVGSLLSQAQAFAADPRLPAGESLALRMQLIRLLEAQGEALAKAGRPRAAVPLLSSAYEALLQLELGGEGEEGELGGLVAEAQATGAAVLALLAFCNLEAGDAQQASLCLQALRQVADAQAAAHFATCFLSLRVSLALGRAGEAEAELLNLVSHEEASPEGCLAGLRAALAAPGGVQLARSGLSLVLERFADEPGIAVDLARAALARASSVNASASSPAGAEGAAAEADSDGSTAAEGPEAGAQAAAEAEALVLELVGDDRLLERVREEEALRAGLLGLLWNHAVAALHSGQGGAAALDSALAFFSAALPLLEEGEGVAATQAEQGDGLAGAVKEGRLPSAVECRRAQALCCMGSGQFGRALEFLEAADQLQPGSLPTAMLRLAVQLQAGSQEGAAQAVEALAGCAAAEPDALRIACVQALDAGASQAARQALLCLLGRCAAAGGGDDMEADGDAASVAGTGGLGSPGYEATVFQNLIQLVLLDAEQAKAASRQAAAADGGSSGGVAAANGQQPAPGTHWRELANLFDRLAGRMRAVGPPAFFLQQEGRPTQQEWFAVQAWNAGQQAGAAGKLQTAAVLLAVAGELYGAMPAPSLANLHRQKMAFLMAAASACQVHEAEAAARAAAAAAAVAAADAEPGAETEAAAAAGPQPAVGPSLALARSNLQQARVAAAAFEALQGGEAGAGGDPKSDVFLLLLDFKLCARLCDVPAQLAALERAKALPTFGAEHFSMALGMLREAEGAARGHGAGTGAGGSPEVRRAAEAARLQRLTQQTPLDCGAAAACLRSLLDLAPSDPEKLSLLGEAAGLLSAAPAGAFPPQEVRWLVTTAWNRGAVHARFGRCAEAERYQRWAVEALAQHGDESMRGHYGETMRAELAKTSAALGGAAALRVA